MQLRANVDNCKILSKLSDKIHFTGFLIQVLTIIRENDQLC